MTKRDPSRCPTHPGAILREDVIPAVKATKTEIAEGLGVSRQTLYDILGEKQSVTPSMALRLAHMFGGSARMWLSMQAAYDLWHAERTLAIEEIPRFEASAVA